MGFHLATLIFLKQTGDMLNYIVSIFFKRLKAIDLLSKEIDQDGIVVRSPVVGGSIGVDGNNRFLNLLRHSMRINHLNDKRYF